MSCFSLVRRVVPFLVIPLWLVEYLVGCSLVIYQLITVHSVKRFTSTRRSSLFSLVENLGLPKVLLVQSGGANHPAYWLCWNCADCGGIAAVPFTIAQPFVHKGSGRPAPRWRACVRQRSTGAFLCLRVPAARCASDLAHGIGRGPRRAIPHPPCARNRPRENGGPSVRGI